MPGVLQGAGETLRVVAGPFGGFVGTIKAPQPAQYMLRLSVSFLGREIVRN
jgi:transcription antitermination factor NusG